MTMAQLKQVAAAAILAGCSGPEHMSFSTRDGGVVYGDMYGAAHAQYIFETEQGNRLMREILDFLSE